MIDNTGLYEILGRLWEKQIPHEDIYFMHYPMPYRLEPKFTSEQYLNMRGIYLPRRDMSVNRTLSEMGY